MNINITRYAVTVTTILGIALLIIGGIAYTLVQQQRMLHDLQATLGVAVASPALEKEEKKELSPETIEKIITKSEVWRPDSRTGKRYGRASIFTDCKN